MGEGGPVGTWCLLGCANAALSYQPKRTLFSVLLRGQGRPRAKACLSRCTSSWTGSTLLSTHQDGPVEESQSALRAVRRGCGPEMSVRSSIWLCLKASPELSFQGLGRGQSRGGEREGPLLLTSSMVHLATAEAEMPATPGRSLQCCSQHTERERSGCADRADRKRDWGMASAVSAGRRRQRQRLAGPCQG